MAYITVPNSFVESATAYATAVNANFAAIVAGTSDASKNLNVNDIACAGSFTPAGAITVKTIMPAIDVTYNLGSAALRWNQVWTNSASVAGSAVVGTLNCTNTAIVNGNCQILTAASLNVYSTANVQDMMPKSASVYDLGAQTDLWNNIWGNSICPNKISFCSGVSIRRNSTTNYMYLDGTQISVVGNMWVQSQAVFADSAVFSADVNVCGSSTVGNVVPISASSYELGSVALRWQNVHADYIQPGNRVTFSSGVRLRFNGTTNYLYYDASTHGMNGLVKVNDALEVGGTATIQGNLSLYNVVTYTASAASSTFTPTMLRHEISGYGSGADQTVSFATGSLNSGAVMDLKYTAGAYKARLQSDGQDVIINAYRRHATYIKGDDQSWTPMGMVPCTYVSAASGTSEAVTQLNELMSNMRTIGMMLPS